MKLLDIVLRQQPLIQPVMMQYARDIRPDLEWDIIEWSLACRSNLVGSVAESMWRTPEREDWELDCLKALVFLATSGVQVEHTTCAIRVQRDLWVTFCLMDDDRCPLVLLGCTAERTLEQGSFDLARDNETALCFYIATRIDDGVSDGPWEWPITVHVED